MLRQSACFLAGVALLQIPPITHYRTLGNASRISSKHVAACHIEGFGVDRSVADIARRARVPIGVEEVFDHGTEPTIKIDFPGGTLADLLNKLESQAPEYQWREDDGIIHVLWRGTHLPLAGVVMSYPGAHRKTVEEIWDDLEARPELKAWLDSNHCSRQEAELIDRVYTPGAKPTIHHARRISIDAGSITLGRLLDEAAIKSGASWTVVQSPAGKPCVVSILLPSYEIREPQVIP